MKQTSIFFLSLLISLSMQAQKKNRTALINGTAHIGNGKVIVASLITINGEKIETVADIRGIRLDFKSFDTVIDISGMHVYPGLINANSILGLHDAEAVRATRDFREVGALNPHVRALIAYNTDNIIVPTVRSNGVLYTQATPRGGLISGASSVMSLDGWNWEDAVLLRDDGIHVNFPQTVVKKWNAEEGAVKEANAKFQEEMDRLDKFFSDAKYYIENETNLTTDLRLEAMRRPLSGKANVYFHCDRSTDILNMLGFVKRHGIVKAVLVGAREADKVRTELKQSRIPVMLGRLNDLPEKADEDIDIVFRLPKILQQDSILFAIQMEGDMEAAQSRNLPFNAGAAVAYGLGKEAALASITLNAAKILGVDQWIGSLEEGKLASLVVSEGDILDIMSNKVTLAFIAGKPIELKNRQTELYLRYKNKYGIK